MISSMDRCAVSLFFLLALLPFLRNPLAGVPPPTDPLMSAVASCDREGLKKLLFPDGGPLSRNARGQINRRDWMGRSPLIRAAQSETGMPECGPETDLRRAEIVDLLLAAGAMVHVRDRGGRTALLWAAQNGYFRTSSRLMAAGADPGKGHASGISPSTFGVIQGGGNPSK